MEQSIRETSPAATTQNPGRRPSAALGGLPRPVLVGVIVVVAAAVGLGGLAQAGVLAPQFRNTGGGASGEVRPAGAPHVGWQTLRNVSWRSWKVTSVEVSGPAGQDVIVFVRSADDTAALTDQFTATTGNPALKRLPVTVPAGDELVVLQYQKAGCAGQVSSLPGPTRTRASVGITTPLGQRWIHATLFRGAPTSAACDVAP